MQGAADYPGDWDAILKAARPLRRELLRRGARSTRYRAPPNIVESSGLEQDRIGDRDDPSFGLRETETKVGADNATRDGAVR